MQNNDLQFLHSPGRLRLIISSPLGGLLDPFSARAALRRCPDEFRVLFEEMKRVLEEERRAEMRREKKRLKEEAVQEGLF